MARGECKKVWSGDTGFGGLHHYVCATPVKPSGVKKVEAATPEASRAVSSYKEDCSQYIGDTGFLGIMISRLWVECNSK